MNAIEQAEAALARSGGTVATHGSASWSARRLAETTDALTTLLVQHKLVLAALTDEAREIARASTATAEATGAHRMAVAEVLTQLGCTELRRERDEALAVIERALGVFKQTPDVRKPDAWWPLSQDSEEFKAGACWAENWWRRVQDILDSAPSDVLRAVRAEAWDEGYGAGNVDGYYGTREEKNPYREGAHRG